MLFICVLCVHVVLQLTRHILIALFSAFVGGVNVSLKVRMVVCHFYFPFFSLRIAVKRLQDVCIWCCFDGICSS